MNNLIEPSIITGIIALFKPFIVKLLKYYFIKYIPETLRHDSIEALSYILGFFIALLVNYWGHFNLSLFACFLIGAGISKPVSHYSNKTIKKIQNGKK